MKYSNNQVVEIIKNAFSFLNTEYKLSVIEDKMSDFGYKLVFKGTKTAVSIIFEFREAYVNIILHKLINGEIQNDVYPYKEEVPLNNIGLDFIVKYKDPKQLTKPLYDYTSDYYGKDNAFEIMVNSLSMNLRKFAHEVLIGDFSVFSEVDKFVKEHYKKL